LPRVGSSVSSARLLARPSLFGDGPVLAGAFPFLSASRFDDDIATTKQQTMSICFIKQSKAKTNDDVTTTAAFSPMPTPFPTPTTVLRIRSSCPILYTMQTESHHCSILSRRNAKDETSNTQEKKMENEFNGLTFRFK
ncbi:hypothetical protein T4E_1114, partial [Trichinella pseudospiralis]